MFCDSWECVGAWFNSGVGAAWVQAILTVVAIFWSVLMAKIAIRHDQAAESRRKSELAYQKRQEWAMNLRRAESVFDYASGVLGPLECEGDEQPLAAYLDYASGELQGCFEQIQALILRDFEKVEQIKTLNNFCIAIRAAKTVMDKNVAGDFLDCGLALAQKARVDDFKTAFSDAANQLEQSLNLHAAPPAH